MKIGLWSDSHNFPNLVLMKLSAYHQERGDRVEMLNHLNTYDLVYCSKTFDFTPDADDRAIINADQVIKSGTGYGDLTSRCPYEIEHSRPDYSLFPQFKNTAYGFLTRGCPRGCKFCVVSQKEGRFSHGVSDLDEFWSGEKNIKLLDPNLLASRDHEIFLKQLSDSRAWVDFTQGLDIRFVTPDNISFLNSIKIKSVHFAWDNPNEDLSQQFSFFVKHTKMSKHRRPCAYVLTNFNSTHEQDLYRIYKLKEIGVDPYVMVFNKETAPRETRLLQRWVNNRIIFNSVDKFEDYDWRVG